MSEKEEMSNESGVGLWVVLLPNLAALTILLGFFWALKRSKTVEVRHKGRRPCSSSVVLSQHRTEVGKEEREAEEETNEMAEFGMNADDEGLVPRRAYDMTASMGMSTFLFLEEFPDARGEERREVAEGKNDVRGEEERDGANCGSEGELMQKEDERAGKGIEWEREEKCDSRRDCGTTDEPTIENDESERSIHFWERCQYSDKCAICPTVFSLLNRRHHCRNCYNSVCANCSANRAIVSGFGGTKERVCSQCWTVLFSPDDDGDDGDDERPTDQTEEKQE